MTSIYRDALPAKTTTTYPMTELSALPIPLTVLLWTQAMSALNALLDTGWPSNSQPPPKHLPGTVLPQPALKQPCAKQRTILPRTPPLRPGPPLRPMRSSTSLEWSAITASIRQYPPMEDSSASAHLRWDICTTIIWRPRPLINVLDIPTTFQQPIQPQLLEEPITRTLFGTVRPASRDTG